MYMEDETKKKKRSHSSLMASSQDSLIVDEPFVQILSTRFCESHSLLNQFKLSLLVVALLCTAISII